jgi:hypothetical protein
MAALVRGNRFWRGIDVVPDCLSLLHYREHGRTFPASVFPASVAAPALLQTDRLPRAKSSD